MRGRTLLLIAFGALVGVLVAWWYFGTDRNTEVLSDREIATRMLARHLANYFSQEKILVVSNPFTQQKGQPRLVYAYEEAGIAGLRKGFPRQKLMIDFPQLKPGAFQDPRSIPMPDYTTTPVAFLMVEGAFDELARKHAGAGLVISLIGVPPDLATLQLWRDPAGPKLAFLLPDLWMLGNKQAIIKAFKGGKVAAAVVVKPASPGKQKTKQKSEPVKDYLVLDSDNIQQALADYPQLGEAPVPTR